MWETQPLVWYMFFGGGADTFFQAMCYERVNTVPWPDFNLAGLSSEWFTPWGDRYEAILLWKKPNDTWNERPPQGHWRGRWLNYYACFHNQPVENSQIYRASVHNFDNLQIINYPDWQRDAPQPDKAIPCPWFS